MITLRVYFTKDWLNRRAVEIYKKRHIPNYIEPSSLHIKYMDITFTIPVVENRIKLYGNDQLTSSN
jgi:hypothetical protein